MVGICTFTDTIVCKLAPECASLCRCIRGATVGGRACESAIALGALLAKTFVSLYATIGHGIALYYSTLHYTALHCTALHCTALHCAALHTFIRKRVSLWQILIVLCMYKYIFRRCLRLIRQTLFFGKLKKKVCNSYTH